MGLKFKNIERVKWDELSIDFNCGCHAIFDEKGACYLDVICEEHDPTIEREE